MTVPSISALAPLSGEEIKKAYSILQHYVPEGTPLQIKVLTLQEPLKEDVLAYLEAKNHRQPVPTIERLALVSYYRKFTVIKPRDLVHSASSLISRL